MDGARPAPCRTEPRRGSFDLWFPTMALKQSESQGSVSTALQVLDFFKSFLFVLCLESIDAL